jgi:phosphoribosylaminoimidazole-succinocarboxamide synthase
MDIRLQFPQAHDYALERGIIIADTKLEFGIDKKTNEIILVDEVLTPDSSRFWPADKYEVGKGQDSYDKVCLMPCLTKLGIGTDKMICLAISARLPHKY